MMIAVISANLGNFDPVVEYVKQSVPCDTFLFTDDSFPPRVSSMLPRLQARIPKCFGWQMVPDYDYYLWVDSSCALRHEHSVVWFLEHCRGADFAFFKHPERNTIHEEYEFLKKKVGEKNKYLYPRYYNELLEEQMREIESDPLFIDDKLFASTAFIYKNKPETRAMLKEWWYHISRYHTIDQLALPYVLYRSKCKANIINVNYLKTPYLTYTRNGKWRKNEN
jgi:hypothetical protein